MRPGVAWRTLTPAPNMSKLHFRRRRNGRRGAAWRTGTSPVTSCEWRWCELGLFVALSGWTQIISPADKSWRSWQRRGTRTPLSWSAQCTTTPWRSSLVLVDDRLNKPSGDLLMLPYVTQRPDGGWEIDVWRKVQERICFLLKSRH